MKKILSVISMLLSILAISSCNNVTQKPMHVVIVPGYGAPVEGNSKYEEYISKAFDFISDENNKVDLVIATGGYTVLKDTSEAESIIKYMSLRHDLSSRIIPEFKTYAESCSIITWQNILFSKQYLDSNNIKPTHVTIFGDAARQDMLLTYAMYQFAGKEFLPIKSNEILNTAMNFKILKLDFQGYDFGTKNYVVPETTDEIIKVYLDPKAGDQELEERIAKWTTNFKYDVKENLGSKACKQSLSTSMQN